MRGGHEFRGGGGGFHGGGRAPGSLPHHMLNPGVHHDFHRMFGRGPFTPGYGPQGQQGGINPMLQALLQQQLQQQGGQSPLGQGVGPQGGGPGGGPPGGPGGPQGGYGPQGSANEPPNGGAGGNWGNASVDQVLDAISHFESPGGNDPNYRYDPTHTAQGYFQITNTTWRENAAAAGVDVRQYPNAMSAPYALQRQVARYILTSTPGGIGNWSNFNPNLASWLRSRGYPTAGAFRGGGTQTAGGQPPGGGPQYTTGTPGPDPAHPGWGSQPGYSTGPVPPPGGQPVPAANAQPPAAPTPPFVQTIGPDPNAAPGYDMPGYGTPAPAAAAPATAPAPPASPTAVILPPGQGMPNPLPQPGNGDFSLA